MPFSSTNNNWLKNSILKWTDLFFKNESTLKKLANFDPKNALTPHTVNNLHFMSKNSILGKNRQLWILIFRLEKIIHNFLIFFWNWILGHNLRFCNSVFCPPLKESSKIPPKNSSWFYKRWKITKKQRRISSRYILLFMCNTKFFSWWYLKIDKVGKKHLVFEAKILMDDVMLWKLTFLDEESYQPIQTNIDGNIYFLK